MAERVAEGRGRSEALNFLTAEEAPSEALAASGAVPGVSTAADIVEIGTSRCVSAPRSASICRADGDD